MTLRLSLATLVSTLLAVTVFASTPAAPLRGWVDMHTHPMAHLGFGGKLLHGAPDLGILVPAIPSGAGCRHYEAATNRADASYDCRAIHGGFDLLNNTCGDLLRREFIRGFESSLGARTGHQEDGAFGFPAFNSFPAHNDLLHQQMWVDWIRRAYDGGLRVMVALAVNNRTIAAAVMGAGDINGDDASSALVQIRQTRLMIDQHGWMEVAETPADLRRIVGENKLAVVLGVEVDNIGNMQWEATVNPAGDEASQTFVRNQLQALWTEGVRYVFPIHVVDNKLGGTAIYQDEFNTSNLHQTGAFWNIDCAPAGSGITHQFQVAGFDLGMAVIKVKIGIDPFAFPPTPPGCTDPQFSSGHINNKDLSPLGEYAIEEMMRMGLLIDIDHMSTRAVQETLTIAEGHGYPLNAGHNAPRNALWSDGNEAERTDDEYRRLSALGGVVGLGSTDRASNFVRNYHHVSGVVNGMQLAIGTDANGMVKLPGPDPAVGDIYVDGFTPLTDGGRTWNIQTDGVANYGLFADYVRSWPRVGMATTDVDDFFSTAEGFARMWERAEVARVAMIPAPPVAHAGGPYSVDESGSVTLDTSGTTDVNQPADTLTYEWDFDGDGSYDDATGVAPVVAAGDGPATITVSLRVTDEDAMTDTASSSITVRNVAPSATLTQLPPTLVFQGLSASFQFSAVNDPSAADVAAGFSFSADCTSDGVIDVAPSSSTVVTCTYPAGGVFTVGGRITDKDGGAGSATTTVTVLTPLQAMDAIAAMIGSATELMAKLNQARRFYEAGRIDRALHHLDVLLHQVEIQGNDELAYWIRQLKASITA